MKNFVFFEKCSICLHIVFFVFFVPALNDAHTLLTFDPLVLQWQMLNSFLMCSQEILCVPEIVPDFQIVPERSLSILQEEFWESAAVTVITRERGSTKHKDWHIKFFCSSIQKAHLFILHQRWKGYFNFFPVLKVIFRHY